MTALDVLIRTREDETRMLGMIGRQVRQMLQTKRLSAQGIRSADEIARAIGVQSFVARNYLRWNTRYSEEDLAAAAERCAAAEEEIKTGRTAAVYGEAFDEGLLYFSAGIGAFDREI